MKEPASALCDQLWRDPFLFFLFQRFCKLTRCMTTKISALVEFMLWSSGLFFFNNQINISVSYFDHEAMKRFVSLWLCLANGLRSDPRFWDFEPFIYDLWNNKISNQIIGHGSFKIVSTIELNRCSPLIVKLTKSVEYCRKSGLRYNFDLSAGFTWIGTSLWVCTVRCFSWEIQSFRSCACFEVSSRKIWLPIPPGVFASTAYRPATRFFA